MQAFLVRAIATVGGLGYLPVAPGTVGSAVGLLIVCFSGGDFSHQLAQCALMTLLAVWSSGSAAKMLGSKDPRPVIIDEVAGMMVALVGLPVYWPVYLAAFFLFRLLDILKPFPLRRFEDLPGGWGIVLDDLGAGLLANGIVRIFIFL